MEQNRRGAQASYVALTIFIAVWIFMPSAVRRLNREAFTEFQAPAMHLVSCTERHSCGKKQRS